jgi:hypothetical protein
MRKQLLWLIIFSISMGFLETAVVVYLRELYYPQGFNFPLSYMDPSVFVTELLREVATLIMLAGVAYLGGRTSAQRFSFFLIAFAIWDLFYYVFLKALLDWPESVMTWDILFLVPVPWVGPVLAPCVVSVTMVLLGVAILHRDAQQAPSSLNLMEWALMISGSVVLLISWTSDYFAVGKGLLSEAQATEFFSTYVPQSYNWWLFGLAEVLLLSGIAVFFIRTGRKT